MASKMNEEIMKTNLDIPEGEIKVTGAVNPVYADAINVHNKKKKEIENTLEDAGKVNELKEPFTGSTDKKNMPKDVEYPKVKLEESLFEDYSDAPDTYQEIFRVMDNIEHIVNYVNDLQDEDMNYEDMRQSYDVLEEALMEFKGYISELAKAEGKPMREAYAYDGADQMGRAQCSPLVPDFSGTIRDYVKHYGEDKRYDHVIMSSLKDTVVRLLDSKQEVENFNAYWSERYPLLIKYIDDQIALVPFDVLNYGDGKVEEDLHEAADEYKVGEIYYKSDRGSLADIIMDELTMGEIVYRYAGKDDNGKDKWTPTQVPGMHLDVEETAVVYDDSWTIPYVQALVSNETQVKEIEEIGKKYNRPVTSKFENNGRNSYWRVKIELKPGEDEESFTDDNIQIRRDGRKK